MKRIISIMLLVLIAISIIACQEKNTIHPNETSEIACSGENDNIKEVAALKKGKKVFYCGMDSATIIVDGTSYEIATVLENKALSEEEFFNYLENEVSENEDCYRCDYLDGGSVEYRMGDYFVIKYNTLDGNRNIAIAVTDKDFTIGSIANAMQ